jgi:hypothetical protein
MKKCNLCQIEKTKTEFYKKNTAKDGLFWWCRSCHKEKMKVKYHELAKNETYKIKEKERVSEFWLSNPDIRKKCDQDYANKNRFKLTAKVGKYRSLKMKRTPSWLTSNDFWIIEQVYELAALRTKMFGFQWQVDHVIPLQGKLVSGLHVPDNLRVIPARDNRSKSNHFTVVT